MEYHVDRRVILSPESERPSVYEWSITEITPEGKVGAEKQIPWEWTLWFQATDITLFDSLDKQSVRLFDKGLDDADPIIHRRSITARLRPSKGRRASWEETRYSFFGTNRIVSEMDLRIEELGPEEERERCQVWGSPSYTAEGVNFLPETTDDYLGFHLFVKHETFARFATQISLSAVTDVSFGVGGVPGFYSRWSPTVVTDRIKILSSLGDQRVEIPDGASIEPPRLGQVREFHLALSSAHKLQPGPDEEGSSEGGYPDEPNYRPVAVPAAPPSPGVGQNSLASVLNQLRIAAWMIVALLLFHLVR